MSFCPHCGAPIPEGNKFCSKCGSPVPSQSPQTTGYPDNSSYRPAADPYYKPGRKQGGKLLLILLAVIAVLAALIILLIFKIGPFADSSGSGISGAKASKAYEQPVADLFSAMEQKDAEMILDLFPEEISDLFTEIYGSRDAAAQALEESAFGTLNTYDDIRISYEITDVYHISEDDLEDLRETYLDETGISIDITDAYSLGVDASPTADGTSEDDFAELTVIECGGKWYLDIISIAEL